MRSKVISTVMFAAAAMVAPATAHAAGSGGLVSISSTWQPGATIEVELDCVANGGDMFGLSLQLDGNTVDHHFAYSGTNLTMTIPADVPMGAGLVLAGACSNTHPSNVVIQSYGPVYIVVGQGIVDALPSFGRSSTDLTLVATALVAAGMALVLVPRRRTA